MLKRALALIAAVCMTVPSLALAATETPYEEWRYKVEYMEGWTPEIITGYYTHDSEVARNIKYRAVYDSIGPQYHEPDKEEFDASSPVLYTARLITNISAYADRDINSERVILGKNDGVPVEVLYVGTYWCVVRNGKTYGYAKREKLINFKNAGTNTMPYGVQKHSYVAKTAKITYVRIAMSEEDPYWVVLRPGTTLTIWKILNGWAIVNYQRCYGYINLNDLTDLVPVSPTDTPITDETPIAAYTSYYGMSQTETNLNRLNNIQVGCRFLTRVIMPGEEYNCNKIWGPYRESTGYLPAPVLINGETKQGFGGGTCQVSSTIYNALIQLPGIQIINRHPHGPSGAAYLPHGVDAAVGDDSKNLNLIFKNRYDFPIRIQALSNDDGALCMLIYKATDEDVAAYQATKASK